MLATTVLLAIRAIRTHLLRSILTTLGIVIGVSSVVTMVTLGQATAISAKQQIASLGANILQVFPGQGFGRGGGGPQPPNFKYSDVSAIAGQIAGVKVVAPLAQSTGSAVHEGGNWTTSINGTTRDYFTAQQWYPNDGRIFTPAEDAAGKAVCVIGTTVRTNLFKGEEPVGERLRVRDVSCTVIGVLSTRGQGGFGQDQDNVVIMPIKAVQRRFTGSREIRNMMVAVDDNYDTGVVQAQIESLLRQRRGISGDKEDDFNVFDTKQISDAVTGIYSLLTRIVGGVAAISLLVGGIGIMNIMLVSVTERTREIGIRLAIGAVQREVLQQFLVEAVVLSCLGGLVGLALAFVAVLGLSIPLQVPFVFDPKINLIAFAFSALIGVIFGYFPARRAAALNPIDALRHE